MLDLMNLAPWIAAAAIGSYALYNAGRRRSSEDARAAVKEGAFLLDVRSPQEFQRRHLEGATNIPVSHLSQRLQEVPSCKKVVVYCKSGGRSRQAAHILRSAGLEVIDLGPMSAW